MPSRKDQRNQELKRAVEALTWRVKVSYLIISFYDGKILADFTAHYQYFYLSGEKSKRFLIRKFLSKFETSGLTFLIK